MEERKKNQDEQPRKLNKDLAQILGEEFQSQSNLLNPVWVEIQPPIAQVYVKQETFELPVMDIQEETTSTNVEPCDPTSQILNFEVKESVEENSHDSQIFSTPSNDTTIPPTDSIKLKRKNEFKDKIKMIRKRMKMEPEEEQEPNNLFNRVDSTTISSTVDNTDLLPAQILREEFEPPPSIEIENNISLDRQSDLSELFNMVKNARNRKMCEMDMELSCSSSTVPPVHANEETVSNLDNLNSTSMIENRITLQPITHACIKQEPSELPVTDIQEETTSRTIVEPCDSTSQILNFEVKEESVEENSHDSQIFSTPNNSNTSQEESNSVHLKKRKEFVEKVEIIRKRIKMEPEPEQELDEEFKQIDSTELSSSLNNIDENICASDGKILENGVSELNSSNINVNKDTDNDVVVLPAEKSEKDVEVICLSDSDDDDENAPVLSSEVNVIPPPISKNAQVFSSETNKQVIPPQDSDLTCVKEKDGVKKFSTNILRYFNITSKLNRYHCHKTLDFLKKYKTDNPIENFFPKVKKEGKITHEIKEEDFLFEKVIPTPSESIPILNNVNCNTNQFILCTNFRNVTNTSPNRPITEPTLQNLPSVSQSAVFLPKLSNHTSPNNGHHFPNPHSVMSSASNSQEHLPGVTKELLRNILENPSLASFIVNLGNSNMANPQKKIIPVTSAEIIPSLPITSQPFHTSQKSPISSEKAMHNFELSSHSSVNFEPTTSSCVKNLSPHGLRKKLNIKRRGNIKVNNVAMVPFQSAVSQPLSAFQKPSISSKLPIVDVALPSCSSVNRDPRLATKATFPPRKENERDLLNKNCKVIFPPRKGCERDLLLYKICGKSDISDQFEKLVLQWNPEWLYIQEDTKSKCVPPIFESDPCVATSYKDEEIYYNTYVPLHLLHIWFVIFEKWFSENKTVIRSTCISVEKTDDRIKILCSAELGDDVDWPMKDDIVWCKHNEEMAFLRIEDVRKKLSKQTGVHKLKISLESLHDLKLHSGDEMRFVILFNIRIACLKTRSLKSFDNHMKDVILKPEKNAASIAIIHLQQNRKPKEHRNEIIKIVSMPHTLVCLIQIYDELDRALLITLLAYVIAYGMKNQPDVAAVAKTYRSKLLICLKNEELLPSLYRRLIEYKPVLVVRSKQIKLKQDLIKYTVEYKLEKKGNLTDILNNNQIFITTFSAFSTAEKQQMSKIKKLACLVDDAHLCTELETALLLPLKLKKLLLIGDKNISPQFHSYLTKYKLNLSLFARLFEAKSLSC